ncbi:MAG: Uma2 family endonuclease [bacterium]|nr:Uma2 family endonuclease [bacterium]
MEDVNEPIMDYNVLDLNKTYTYADYMRWMFKERVELIKGKIVKMSPAPNNKHQELSFKLTGLFYNLFNKHSCKVYAAPFDVILPVSSPKKDSTIVQPDLCVVCDLSKLESHGCHGAPDLIIEILSPGNSKHDLNTKFKLYEESGVKEYWVVNPFNETIHLYVLENNFYKGLHPFTKDEIIQSTVFSNLKISVNSVFDMV